MKAYEKPKFEIVVMNKSDIICTSGGGLINGGSGNLGGGDVSGDDIFD